MAGRHGGSKALDRAHDRKESHMFGSTTGSFPKPLAVVAVALGLAAGSYGVASAASGSGSSSGQSSSSAQTRSGSTGSDAGRAPWGRPRSDETELTGDTLAKVRAAAVAEVGSDATVVRVETDADGHAAYEAHMVKADGTPVTVYVDTSFAVVSVESR
jgi:uncharacterized membrane protein YkoI